MKPFKTAYVRKTQMNKQINGHIEKVPRGNQGEKSSKDMIRARDLVSTIGAQANPHF